MARRESKEDLIKFRSEVENYVVSSEEFITISLNHWKSVLTHVRSLF